MIQISDLNQIPPFWQGIVTSLVATAIAAFAALLFKIFFSNWTEARAKYKSDWVKTKDMLASQNPALRIDGFFNALARGIRYFVLGSLAWVISDMASFLYLVSNLIAAIISVLADMIAVTMFIFAGRWIYLLLVRKIEIHAS